MLLFIKLFYLNLFLFYLILFDIIVVIIILWCYSWFIVGIEPVIIYNMNFIKFYIIDVNVTDGNVTRSDVLDQLCLCFIIYVGQMLCQ